ncbi:Bardet-Biedl syndrome 4 protein homolog isoform X2 [Apis dorsata]|uniref:Bardet-Biedl syndrome 4 protein homolog isoform X2 n=1 Tax=Apis dorsata TaxID=7462 RepID=UPI001292F990|nr:Bardet-Biedl syndrome 4 protein homolog isoform X2 [Apis dorsata]
MTNNIFSNGRIQQQTIVSQRLRNDKGKKAPEIPAIESNNWLLHRHYTRHEYKTCKILIDQELIKSNGYNEYANYLKGLILRREGKIQDSLNYFQAAYNVNSTNINNVKQIAKSFENPESIEAATELGLLYLKIGDVQRAFQQFGTAIAHSPNYAKAILPIAYIIQNHQEYDVALSKYKQAAQSIPESYALWNNVGMCFYGKQKFVAAISCLKRAHYLNSMAFLPAYNLGMVFLTTGQPASAAIYLCAAITADPKNSMPYLLLGIALKRLDDLEGAEKVLQKAHALSPQDPFVLINYAVILEAQGKENMAAELLSALNDITAVIDVDAQITQTAKKLSMKLQQERVNGKEEEETRVLNSDEV